MGKHLKILLKKAKGFLFIYIALCALSVIAFAVINFSFNEHSAAFEAKEKPQYQLDIPFNRDDIKQFEVEANHAKLEIGMANNIDKPKIMIYDKNYKGQHIKTDVKGKKCLISLEGVTSSSSSLCIRVLLPQNQLEKLEIKGEDLDLDLDRMRANFIRVKINDGYAYMANVNTNLLEAFSVKAPLRLYNNRIAKLDADVKKGSTTLIENKINFIDYQAKEGDVFSYSRKIDGEWSFETSKGDIQFVTQTLPYNLMIDAIGEKVKVNYDKRFWKEPDIVEKSSHQFQGSVGHHVTAMIHAKTALGKIEIGKRERYTNLDPYQQDYPFDKENPYIIERGTKHQ